MPPQLKDAKQKRKKGNGKVAKPVVTPTLSLPHVASTSRQQATPQRIFNPSLSDPAKPRLPGNTGHLASVSLPLHLKNPFTPPSLSDPIPGFPVQPNVPDIIPTPSIPNVIPGSGAINGVLSSLDWLTDPARLIKIIGGGVLIFMGLHQLTKQITGATPGQHVGGAISKLTKAAEIGAAI